MSIIKKLAVAPLLIASSFLIIQCNDASDKTTMNETDTTTMVKKDLVNADTMAVSKDTSFENTPITSSVKPNPAKKGKKGNVSVVLAENKNAKNTDQTDNEGYYTNVYPSYPGGQKKLADYFRDNIQYPQDASDNGVEGTVNISFTVDEKGKINSVKAVNPSIGYGIEEEALRVFNQMPAWLPGNIKGKNVKTRYTLPVKFELAD